MGLFYIYRFLNRDGEIIYIGRTNNLELRMYQHFSSGHLDYEAYSNVFMIDYLEFENETDHYIAEIYLINKYKPMYNKRDKIEGNMSVSMDIEEEYSIYKVFSQRRNNMFIDQSGMVVISGATPVYHAGEVGFYNSVVTMREVAEAYPLLTYDGDAQRGIEGGKPVVIKSHIKEIKESILDGEPIRGSLIWNVRDEGTENIIAVGEDSMKIIGSITVPDSWHRHCAIREIYEEDPENEMLDSEMVLNIHNLTKAEEINLFVDINGKGKAPNSNRVKFLSDSITSQFTRDLIDNSNLKGRIECVKQSAQNNKITKFSTIHDALFSSNGVYKTTNIKDEDVYKELLSYLTEFVNVLLDSRPEFTFETTAEKRNKKRDNMILEEISWYAYFKMAKRFTERGTKNWQDGLVSRMNYEYRQPSGEKFDFWAKKNYVFTPVVKYVVSVTSDKPIPTGSCINSNTTRRNMQSIVDMYLFTGVFG